MNLKTYSDPRLYKLIEPSTQPILITDQVYRSGSQTELITVQYELPYFGRPLGGNGVVDGWNLNGFDNILSGISTDRFSKLKEELFMTENMSFNIITNAETNFIKSEAKLLGWGGSRSAEEYYYDGIDASFEQYEVNGSAAYKEKDGIKWGTSSQGDRGLYSLVTSGISSDSFDKIARQRWLASFNQGHDIWCMQKKNKKIAINRSFQS